MLAMSNASIIATIYNYLDSSIMKKKSSADLSMTIENTYLKEVVEESLNNPDFCKYICISY